jgi:hypothetical protein
MDCRVKPGNDDEPVSANGTARIFMVAFDELNARRRVA